VPLCAAHQQGVSANGTLWVGRHSSRLVQFERYLLTCMRDIEPNPVRVTMVEAPEEYRWSSFGVNGLGDTGWLVPHGKYLGVGDTAETRCHT